jgi:hypothetical protein
VERKKMAPSQLGKLNKLFCTKEEYWKMKEERES